MGSGWIIASLAVLAAAQAALALGCALAWRGARSRLGSAAASLRAMESRLARLEAAGVAPTSPKATGPAVRDRLSVAIPSRAVRLDRAAPAPTAAPSHPAPAPTLIAVPNLSAPPPTAPVQASLAAAELGRRFGDVWALADSGAPPEAIARDTGQPIGQVELILGLRRQLQGAQAAGGRS